MEHFVLLRKIDVIIQHKKYLPSVLKPFHTRALIYDPLFYSNHDIHDKYILVHLIFNSI
jgi:hypothetical protein